METDHIWIKQNPNQKINGANAFGQHFLNEGAANYKEQLEMSYRSLGQNYDWELEKYRMASKASDTGNRRRFFKNLARFIKHPIGYAYWKSHNFRKGTNNMMLLFGIGMIGSLL